MEIELGIPASTLPAERYSQSRAMCSSRGPAPPRPCHLATWEGSIDQVIQASADQAGSAWSA